MKYLIFISLFLIQFVFGEEDPSFEESNDIPEGKIAVCFTKNCNFRAESHQNSVISRIFEFLHQT